MDKIPMPAKGAVGFTLVKAGVTHWHMRDLRLIRPQQMTTDHAMRVLRMYCNSRLVRRQLIAEGCIAMNFPFGGDGACAARDEAVDELFGAAWSRDEGLGLRLQFALKIPLAGQIFRVLAARGVTLAQLVLGIQGLGDVFVPSDYSSLPLWSMSPPARPAKLSKAPKSAIESSSDWDSDTMYGNS